MTPKEVLLRLLSAEQTDMNELRSVIAQIEKALPTQQAVDNTPITNKPMAEAIASVQAAYPMYTFTEIDRNGVPGIEMTVGALEVP